MVITEVLFPCCVYFQKKKCRVCFYSEVIALLISVHCITVVCVGSFCYTLVPKGQCDRVKIVELVAKFIITSTIKQLQLIFLNLKRQLFFFLIVPQSKY